MKKSVSLLLIISLVLSAILIPEKLLAEEEVNNTITCEWRDNNRTLVIKGKGRLTDDWEKKVKKWYPYCNRLIIEKGITSIAPSAFYDLEPDSESIFEIKPINVIESIKLPEGLKILEESTFSDVKNLKKVELPSTLEKIEESAFDGCRWLESIEIPASVTYIGKHVFSSCLALRKITLPKSLQTCKDKFEECPVTTVVNRSSLSLPLDNSHKRKTWYVNGKKKSNVPAGKTAKAKGKKYKIKYDLRGGKARCKLPKTYRYGDGISFPMKKVTKKGWYLIEWAITKGEGSPIRCYGLYPSAYGNTRVHPVWIKYTVKNVKGKKIKIYVKNYNRITNYGFVARYATKKDMSDAKLCPKDPFSGDHRWGKKAKKYTLKGLKKGKKYYIEIAPRFGEDLGDWCGKRCVKIKK